MIYIDASRYNNTAKRTGVENYSYFLINELAKLVPDNIKLISPKEIDLNIRQLIIPFPRLWTQIRLSWEVFNNKEIDNLFVPSHLLPLIHPKKSTITIHDVAWKHVPESYGFLSKIYLNWGAQYAVKNAKKIIVPSATTKNDLIKFFKANAKKIHVVPLGFEMKKPKVTEENENNILSKWNLKRKKYLLYIGRIEHKKNTDNLIKAFELLNDSNLKLVLTGFVGRGGKEILDAIPNSMKDKIIITDYVSDEEKHTLLKNTSCFVFPSRYEGFGIPLLEAMSYDLPIIASNIPTSIDIAKDNAKFFDVDNSNELAKKMNEVINKKDVITNHSNTLKKYSWENCAKETIKIIN